jgi:hypothetical protein
MFNYKTVESVLSGFKKLVTDLEAIEQRELANQAHFTKVVDENIAYANLAKEEATHARKTANKIKELIA